MRIFGRKFSPGQILTAAAVFVGGSLLGVGLFTFGFANGWAYLGSDPATCAQCHIMEDWHESWQRGSHANVATCNDCHMPHTNVAEKYVVKGILGFNHAYKFTTGRHPENLEASDLSKRVIQDACIYCHGDMVSEIHITRTSGEEVSCARCHADVGHL
ncbi:MAG TPA: cytochrome c nitrite reductase small subunit [Actinomycetaceae bacterium]|nr:cytochrome c nitrite reductase small subunit [Actinomycetaceae bacterium]